MTPTDGITKTSLTIDHIVPVCLGGDNKAFNLVACCFGCNQKKGNQLVVIAPSRANARQAKKRRAKLRRSAAPIKARH